MPLIRSLCVCIQLIVLCLLTGVGNVIVRTEASSIPYQDGGKLHKRALYAISGLSGQQGNAATAPPRLEIRKLRENNAQWNLFLLALNDFYYNKDQSDKLSFYRVAGIHGRPFETWDDVAFNEGQSGGYCPHASTLFPTWHRPYLALYEQVIYDTVQQIAATQFNGNTEYAQAAATFRIPYWDWAAPAPIGKPVVPDPISGSPWIQISKPTGNEVISNPLFQYHFRTLDQNQIPDPPVCASSQADCGEPMLIDKQFNRWNYTLRYPDSQGPNAQSQNKLVVLAIQQAQSSYSQRFVNLLENYQEYKNFSNKAWYPNSVGSYDSLESLHDQVHGVFGTNGGHMAYVRLTLFVLTVVQWLTCVPEQLEYSAFDPVFWLHHCNVDRLLAIWQAIYPNSWIEPEETDMETATIKSGDILTGETPLKPFHKNAAGDFWTSTTSRDVAAFGYTYPEIQGGTPASTRQAVNALYGSSSIGKIARRSEAEGNVVNRLVSRAFGRGAYGIQSPDKDRDGQSINRRGLAGKIRAVGSLLVRALGRRDYISPRNDESTYTEWISNVRVAQDALPTTFYIYMFLGNYIENPALWSTDPNLVGTHSVFNSIAAQGDSKKNRIITGTIPLTEALRRDHEAGKVDINDEKAVEDYLTKSLFWRVSNVRPCQPHPSLSASFIALKNNMSFPVGRRRRRPYTSPRFKNIGRELRGYKSRDRSRLSQVGGIQSSSRYHPWPTCRVRIWRCSVGFNIIWQWGEYFLILRWWCNCPVRGGRKKW